MSESVSNLLIGWASRDVTPNGKVSLCGQFHIRLTEEVHDPLTVTALALESSDKKEQAIIVSLLTFGLVWATPRLRILNPVRAHWVNPTTSRLNSVYQSLWTVYRILGRIGQTITITLEGEGGIMWTLLFLALFVVLLTQGTP